MVLKNFLKLIKTRCVIMRKKNTTSHFSSQERTTPLCLKLLKKTLKNISIKYSIHALFFPFSFSACTKMKIKKSKIHIQCRSTCENKLNFNYAPIFIILPRFRGPGFAPGCLSNSTFKNISLHR